MTLLGKTGNQETWRKLDRNIKNNFLSDETMNLKNIEDVGKTEDALNGSTIMQ